MTFPRLDALFKANPIGYRRIAEGDPTGFARREAERLLEQAARCNGVSGLEKLATDGSSHVNKFVSLLSELGFALLFSTLGAQVALLRDEAFNPAIYTPDLLVRFTTGLELLVDVVRAARGSAPLAEALAARLTAQTLNYTVEFCLGIRLSVPAVDVSTHTAAKELCAKVADEIVLALNVAGRPDVLGVVRVYEAGSGLSSEVILGADAHAKIYDDASGSPKENWIGSFGFAPCDDDRRSAGGGVTAVHLIDDATLGAKFLEKIRFKADKRQGLPAAHKRTPFVVALQSHESELRPVTVLSTLTGPRTWNPPPKPAAHVPRFEAARERGWEPVLSEWGYVGSTAMLFPSHGAFGDAGATWAREVSGVIVLHDSDTVVQWLPNPFAANEIADTRLMQIGLPLDILGAPSPTLERTK